MTSQLEKLNPRDAGERLRVCRENAGITQAKAAQEIGVARTTLVAIEQGKRRIRINEIQKLANLYGSSVNALLRDEAVHVDIKPKFRKLAGAKSEKTLQAIELLNNLSKAEVELENLLGIKRSKAYPPERPLMKGDIRKQAEQNAQELRQWLGLGMRPIADIVTLLEMEMDVRVYMRKLDSTISGLFTFDEVIGPCILLNASHPKDRRNYSGAHECGHLVSTRLQPEIQYRQEKESSREERYANMFASEFLMPERTVRSKFNEILVDSRNLTRRHIIILAHYFHVSREAFVRRLEELDLVNSGAWDYFSANGGITNEQVRAVLGDLAFPEKDGANTESPVTIRLNLLSAEVYKKGLLSEGQLARLLNMDRIQLREMLNNPGLEEGLH